MATKAKPGKEPGKVRITDDLGHFLGIIDTASGSTFLWCPRCKQLHLVKQAVATKRNESD